MGKPVFTRIKGVKDVLPDDAIAWNYIFHRARQLFRTFGYSEIIIPVIELTDLFLRSIGETTDIVEKEMYTFTDRDGKKISLRPEGTASVVRAFIENRLYEKAPFHKLCYMGPMFRRERPQAGRYRQFYQIGAEVFGFSSPVVDGEIIYMLHLFFRDLNIQDLEIQINSIGCPVCRPDFRKSLKAYLEDKLQDLCENCRRRFYTNPLRILDCKVPSCQAVVGDAPRTIDYLCPACDEHFRMVQNYLKIGNVDFIINPRLVRGLDYYTRTTFEFVSKSLGAQNTVAAGGRYDNLVEELGGPSTPATGFSIGVERLLSIFNRDLIKKDDVFIYIIPLGEGAMERAFNLLIGLQQKGIPSIIDYGEKSLKSHMRRADKIGAPYVIILGEEEITGGFITLRDMKNKTQVTIPFSRAPEELKDITST